MSSSKKKRMSMLDSLAAAGAPAPTTAMMSSNRALRSARDAVDAHQVWELDPNAIIDDRPEDRLDKSDVYDLQDAIETNGQTVPILVRRHPSESDRYLLVYGRRRLEAIRQSDKVATVRALVANMDDQAAVRAQISENMARRDLSYIEKALFAQELIRDGFGNQSQVAEVLTVGKSAISMALAIVDMVGADLIRMIGPAHGIGRPRWEALGKAIEASGAARDPLIRAAEDAHTRHLVNVVSEDAVSEAPDASVAAFEAVEAALQSYAPKTSKSATKPPARLARARDLTVAGARYGRVRHSEKGVAITLDSGAFADWVASEAQDLVEELHARWLKRAED